MQYSNRFVDKILPILLFGSLGLYGWAIRGTNNYGAIQGCIFAGLLIANAWFLLSRHPSEINSRRYSSGWVILAIVIGIGIGGMHGWMQWPQWSLGQFPISTEDSSYLYINPIYGYIWTFIGAVPWSGMGAVLLAWTGSQIPLKKKDWILRICCGAGGSLIAIGLFYAFPQVFLPLYNETNNYNPVTCPQCHRAFNDNIIAIIFLGLYLGFLVYEIIRKDKMNVKLILIVGLTTGICWVLFRPLNYFLFYKASTGFNWWRVWETASGFGIGLGYALGFIFCNRAKQTKDQIEQTQIKEKYLNAEIRLGIYFPLIVGIFWGIYCSITGFIPLLGYDDAPIELPLSLLLGVLGLCFLFIIFRKLNLKMKQENVTTLEKPDLSQYWRIYWCVFILALICGLLVTSDLWNWVDLIYFIYYLLLTVLDLFLLRRWKKFTNQLSE